MKNSSDSNICAFLLLACSQLVSCASPNNICYSPGHVCIDHPRCFSRPICYPLLVAQQMCPPLSIATTTSTSTPQTLCTSAEWNSAGITVISNLYRPHDVAIDSQNNLIVADTENRRLRIYFKNGTNVTLLEKVAIHRLFIDKFDNIYAAESLGNEIKKVSSNYQSITTVAGTDTPGSALDQLVLDGQPGLYVDSNSTLYIADTGNHRVIKYLWNSTSGVVVAGGNGQGPEPNQLNGPYGIYIDEIHEIGAIYICDTFNHRIQKWMEGASAGITVASSKDQLHDPVAILLQPTSNQMIMYIASFDHSQILKWMPYAQEPLAIVAGMSGSVGAGANELFAPRGIRFDKDWNLFVADTGNDRIQKFLFNISSCANND
ncbi:unnamed protein product [Rotaria socialis]|nr:unnamed protein product [Rotaria socialis]CAF3410785.1 unnamed protein product [Rotaria socialis]CAF3466165.1 unnamed protein product [Rotaria socialis]CAF3555225.1 unnamed protein product [Rotaria socialis]CAF3644433.1 unnamed protein product [Rotaria socialis]